MFLKGYQVNSVVTLDDFIGTVRHHTEDMTTIQQLNVVLLRLSITSSMLLRFLVFSTENQKVLKLLKILKGPYPLLYSYQDTQIYFYLFIYLFFPWAVRSKVALTWLVPSPTCRPPCRQLPGTGGSSGRGGKASCAVDLPHGGEPALRCPTKLSDPTRNPRPQGSKGTGRIRLKSHQPAYSGGGRAVCARAALAALLGKDIIRAASASPSACTIFCRCSCFAFSTRNWARWASCWAVAGENRGHRDVRRWEPSRACLLPRTPSPDSPTCLASTAAVYSRLKLSSVMATSSKMRLKSLALSVSSRRISKDTWGAGADRRGALRGPEN